VTYWSVAKKTVGASFDLVVFAGAALGILALFLYQALAIARTDFYVAHHFSTLIPALGFVSVLLCGCVIILGESLRRLREVSARRVLAIALLGFAGLALLTFFTHPTRSQDIYHSLLLGKGAALHGWNPYATTPEVLKDDPWAYPVLAWRDIPMTYGPLWTLEMMLIAALCTSLEAALLLARLVMLAALVGAGFALWRSLGHMGRSAREQTGILSLLALNPFLIQAALVDLHNDVLILAGLTWSYLFLLERRYAASALALVVAGLVKYVTWLLVPVPLWFLLRDRGISLKTVRAAGGSLVAGAGVVWLTYLPFGGVVSAFRSSELAEFLDQLGMRSQCLPGAFLLLETLPLSHGNLRTLGVGLATVTLAGCCWRDRRLQAFTWPLAALLFFATPWFQSWYALWILPLLALEWSQASVVLLTIFLVPTPELVAPLTMSVAVPAGAFYVSGMRRLVRGATPPPVPHP